MPCRKEGSLFSGPDLPIGIPCSMRYPRVVRRLAGLVVYPDSVCCCACVDLTAEDVCVSISAQLLALCISGSALDRDDGYTRRRCDG